MKLPDFLTEVPFGDIRLTGHRIGLYHVVWESNAGSSPERIHEEFPTLSLELIHKVLEFYRQNKAEVDAYVARYEEEAERNSRQWKTLDLDELKRRARAMGILGPKDEWR